MEKKTKLDLTKYNFPKVDGLSMAFPTFDTIPELLEEATNRGFLNSHSSYNDLFSKLFFSGGKVVFKKNISEEFKTQAWAYCRGLMGSFSPKHEHKEAVCAMLMSELLEPKTQE